jgi:hypothetical protein
MERYSGINGHQANPIAQATGTLIQASADGEIGGTAKLGRHFPAKLVEPQIAND